MQVFAWRKIEIKMVGSYCRDDAPVGVLLGGVGDDANAA